jgi:hypothetical protein
MLPACWIEPQHSPCSQFLPSSCSTQKVLTLTIACREEHPPADDIFAYSGCPQPVPARSPGSGPGPAEEARAPASAGGPAGRRDRGAARGPAEESTFRRAFALVSYVLDRVLGAWLRDGISAKTGHQHPAPGRPREHRRRQPPSRPRPAADAQAASSCTNTTLPGPWLLPYPGRSTCAALRLNGSGRRDSLDPLVLKSE